MEKKMKVFCKDCEHYKQSWFAFGDEVCLSPWNMQDNYRAPASQPILSPASRNANNRCSAYEEKRK